MPPMPLNKRGGAQGRNTNPNMNNKGQIRTGQKIHLRRNVTKQQEIQRNLTHMQQAAQKKKVAQELYYSNQGNRSPLLRQTSSNYRAPVHNRLGGNEQPNTSRKPVYRNQPGNKIKLRRTILQTDQIIKNNIIRRRNNNNNKMRNTQSVQNRILKIRQNQIQSKQMHHNNGQKIRLRKMRQGPVNYTVEVTNNNKNKHNIPQHKISLNLNPKLQEEIRLIQNKSTYQEIPPSVPIHPQGIGFTGTSLNDRFSQL